MGSSEDAQRYAAFKGERVGGELGTPFGNSFVLIAKASDAGNNSSQRFMAMVYALHRTLNRNEIAIRLQNCCNSKINGYIMWCVPAYPKKRSTAHPAASGSTSLFSRSPNFGDDIQ